jgi:Flp pilus assembly protein TadG
VSRGQALVELALSAPVVMVLALGSVAVVQIQTAVAGLEAATEAAAGAAVRAPDPMAAAAAAQQRFAVVASGYPLQAATIRISAGDFNRAGELVATSSAIVDIRWAAMGLPSRVSLRATAVGRIEPWRTRRSPP